MRTNICNFLLLFYLAENGLLEAAVSNFNIFQQDNRATENQRR